MPPAYVVQQPPPPVYNAYANAATPGIPPPQPPAYITTPPGFGGGRGRGRGGRGRGQRGRGRRGGIGFQPHPPTAYQQAGGQRAAQYTGGIPPPAGGGGGRGGGSGRNNAPNPYKRWNNWNACYSCGFDVPGWHNSKTCPTRRDDHQEGYTRKNSQQYIEAGHRPCMVGAHKKFLPQPGTQWGE